MKFDLISRRVYSDLQMLIHLASITQNIPIYPLFKNWSNDRGTGQKRGARDLSDLTPLLLIVLNHIQLSCLSCVDP